MNKKSCKATVKIFCMLVTLFFVGCGGGAKDEPTSTEEEEDTPITQIETTLEITPPAPQSVVEKKILKGSAAAGAAIIGVVTVKGAKGLTNSGVVDGNGKFSVEVSTLKAPFILKVEGRVNGRSVLYYSVCMSEGHINITPLTNLIFSHVLKQDTTGSFNSWESLQAKVNQAVITGAERRVRKQISPILTANGVPEDKVDLMKTEFDVNHRWLDGVLDILTIDISGNDIKITNLVTKTTIADSLISETPGQFSSDETQATFNEIKNANSIDDRMKAITDLYATTRPSSGQILEKLAYKIAVDFFENGVTKSTLLENWFAGEYGPLVGMKYSATIIGPMEKADYDTSLYEKGSWVRLNVVYNGFSEVFISSMVYDGKDWLWYGNRQWIDSGNLWADSVKEVGHSGTVAYHTGLNVSLEDRYYYAYNGGIRSAIITGPGLPDAGLTLARNYPEKMFSIFGYELLAGGGAYRFLITDDILLASVPENSIYTVRLFKETPESVTTETTPLQTFSKIVSGRPLLNAELKKETFITITSPTNHRIGSIDTKTPFRVFWSSPAGAPFRVTKGWIILVDEKGVSHEFSTKEIDSANKKFSLDLSSYTGSSITDAELWVRGVDISGRRLENKWTFFNGIPIASAGADTTVVTGNTFQLDGSKSNDPGSTSVLTYSWAVETRPTGSVAILAEATGMNPMFTPDVAGTYVLSLIVSDGQFSSTKDRVTLNAQVSDRRGPKSLNPVAANTRNPAWSWESSIAGSTGLFRIRLDGTPLEDMATGSTETTDTRFTPQAPLSDGVHTLFIQEKNSFGTWSEITEAKIDVDLTPPQPPVFSYNAIITPTKDLTPVWIWSSGQGGAGIYRLKLDDGNFAQNAVKTKNSTYTPDTPLAHGDHILYLQEQDLAGNWSEPASFTMLVDLEGPVLTINSSPATLTNLPDASFSFSASEPGTAFKCNINGQGFLPCDTPKAYPNVGVKSGTLSFSVLGVDSLGNEGAAQTFQWAFDINPPSQPSVTGIAKTKNPRPTWTWASGGSGNGTFRYKLDSNDFSTGAIETTALNFTPTFSFTGSGPHTLYVQERDTAGNWSAYGQFVVAVDVDSPVIAVQQYSTELFKAMADNELSKSDLTSISKLTGKLLQNLSSKQRQMFYSTVVGRLFDNQDKNDVLSRKAARTFSDSYDASLKSNDWKDALADIKDPKQRTDFAMLHLATYAMALAENSIQDSSGAVTTGNGGGRNEVAEFQGRATEVFAELNTLNGLHAFNVMSQLVANEGMPKGVEVLSSPLEAAFTKIADVRLRPADTTTQLGEPGHNASGIKNRTDANAAFGGYLERSRRSSEEMSQPEAERLGTFVHYVYHELPKGLDRELFLVRAHREIIQQGFQETYPGEKSNTADQKRLIGLLKEIRDLAKNPKQVIIETDIGKSSDAQTTRAQLANYVILNIYMLADNLDHGREQNKPTPINSSEENTLFDLFKAAKIKFGTSIQGLTATRKLGQDIVEMFNAIE